MRGPSQVCLRVFLHGLLECIIASPGWCWSDISFHCMFRLCSDAYPSPGSLGFDAISNSVLLPHQDGVGVIFPFAAQIWRKSK